jgi:hypothetical protein
MGEKLEPGWSEVSVLVCDLWEPNSMLETGMLLGTTTMSSRSLNPERLRTTFVLGFVFGRGAGTNWGLAVLYPEVPLGVIPFFLNSASSSLSLPLGAIFREGCKYAISKKFLTSTFGSSLSFRRASCIVCRNKANSSSLVNWNLEEHKEEMTLMLPSFLHCV